MQELTMAPVSDLEMMLLDRQVAEWKARKIAELEAVDRKSVV